MLSQSIKTIKGIGNKKAEFFANLGVYTLLDLMSLYPFRYEDLSKASKVSDLENDEYGIFLARVLSFESGISSGGKKMLKVNLSDNDSRIQAIYVNSPYMQRLFKKDQIYWFYGKCSTFGNSKSVFHPEFHLYSEYPQGLGIRGVYPLSQDLKQQDIRHALESCEKLFDLIPENLPDEILDKYKLMPKSEAMYTMHFPNRLDEIEKAKYRLKFEEIYLQQKEIFELKENHKLKKRKDYYRDIHLDEVISIFDFELTNSQVKTIQEVMDDLKSEFFMNRLIFGDVGSGKTVIAIASSYLAVKSGYQACIMAPTEVLARQHFKEFDSRLGSIFNLSLLVSSVKDKLSVIEGLKSGKINILIGTHALLEDHIEFKDLSMVITDEQHRFGVKQRNTLIEKSSKGADVLSMSATPIPRTLSMVHYGDLDISYLTDMPKGRKTVITKYVSGTDNKKKLLKFIHDRVKEGEQAYFLAPRIEDDEEKTKTSVEKMYAYFKNIYSEFNIAYLHGKMKPEEKSQIMEAFQENHYQILIATTVIEVGVNVPNATIILISNIEHFGLSQLHQLRGRVGRSDKQSYCFLTSKNPTDTVLARVKAMEKYNSGFDIAEIDLKMRGPGEFFGNRQHGFKQFKLVDYVEDYALITLVHDLFS